MGHHHKNKVNSNDQETTTNNLNINELSKMDLNSLINTLKGFNSSDISSLIGQLNLPSGIDKSQLENLVNSPDTAEKLSAMISQLNTSTTNNNSSNEKGNNTNSNELVNMLSKVNSPNVQADEVIKSLKHFLPPDKNKILDKILQMYTK